MLKSGFHCFWATMGKAGMIHHDRIPTYISEGAEKWGSAFSSTWHTCQFRLEYMLSSRCIGTGTVARCRFVEDCAAHVHGPRALVPTNVGPYHSFGTVTAGDYLRNEMVANNLDSRILGLIAAKACNVVFKSCCHHPDSSEATSKALWRQASLQWLFHTSTHHAAQL